MLCYFKKRNTRRRYDVDNYVAEMSSDMTTPVPGVWVVSCRKLTDETEETTGGQDRQEVSHSAHANQVSAHPHGAHSYDLLSCNT